MAFTRGARGTIALGPWTPGTPRVATLDQALTVGRIAFAIVQDNDIGLNYTVTGGGTWTSWRRYTSPVLGIGVIEVFRTIVNSAVSSVSVDADDNGAEAGVSVTVVEFAGQHATPLTVTPAELEVEADFSPDISVSPTVDPSLLIHAIMAGGGSTAVKPSDYTAESSLGGDTHVVSWKETASGNQTASPTLVSGDGNSMAMLVVVDGSGGAGPAGESISVSLTEPILGSTVF